MSDRRAAIRRERNERRKAEKHKAPVSRLERADLKVRMMEEYWHLASYSAY